MSLRAQFEQSSATLLAPETPLEELLKVVSEIRERLEIVHTSEYARFLQHLFPAFLKLLTERTAPQLADNVQHKIRNVVLEIMNRVPANEFLEQYVQDMLTVALDCLGKDNEENALVCLRLIFELHKNFRPGKSMEKHAKPFLDFVTTFYQALPRVTQTTFASPPALPPAAAGAGGGFTELTGDPGTPREAATDSGSALIPSVQSFKVLTECPLIVMLLYQLYKANITPGIKGLVPLMTQALTLPAPAHARADPKFHDFVACQVKTLSFLTYLLRSFSKELTGFRDNVSLCVRNLLASCPPDAVQTRKEILVATRHILATDFRRAFFRDINTFLDASVLIGEGRACHDSLRPLAYSTLADLVHHVRYELSLGQLSRIIHLFSRNIHDASLPISIQTTSVRLLLNLVDNIFHNDNEESGRGRSLLTRILSTLVQKFGTLQHYIPRVLAADRATAATRAADAAREAAIVAGLLQAQAAAGGGAVPAGAAVDMPPVHDGVPPADPLPPPDANLGSIKDIKSLVKTVTMGLKTVVWCASNYRRNPASTTTPSQGAVPRGGAAAAVAAAAGRPPAATPHNVLTEQELRLVAKFFKWGLRVFQVLGGGVGSGGTAHLPADEEKEALEQFGGVFTVMDAYNFRDALQGNMRLFFGHVARHPPLLSVAKHFLLNHASAGVFFDLVLHFIVQHLHLLNVDAAAANSAPDAPASARVHRPPPPGTARLTTDIGVVKDVSYPTPDDTAPASVCAAILLRLFKISIASITHLFQDNERILRPHLVSLVRGCIRNAATCRQPIHHLFVLRSLFRAVAHRKFEQLYEEFPPLIPMLLESLVRMHDALKAVVLKDLVIELCLTIPARLESQLPHLQALMMPLIAALRSRQDKNELAVVGFKTLEFWIDNLNPAYLYPIMAQEAVLYPLMTALCDLLKPPPSLNGQDALRVLGKLGGRNRLFLMERPLLPYQPSLENGVVLRMTWDAAGRAAPAAGADARDVFPPAADTTGLLPLDGILEAAHETLTRFFAEDAAGGKSPTQAILNRLTLDPSKATATAAAAAATTPPDVDTPAVDADDAAEAQAASTSPTLSSPGYVKQRAWNAISQVVAASRCFEVGRERTPWSPSAPLKSTADLRCSVDTCVTSPEALARVLHAMALAAADFHIKSEEARGTLEALTRDLTGVAVQRTLLLPAAAREGRVRGDPLPDLKSVLVDPLVVNDAIVRTLTDGFTATTAVGLAAISTVYDVCVAAAGGSHTDAAFTHGWVVLTDLCSRLCHACFALPGGAAVGACAGLVKLVELTDRAWLLVQQEALLGACVHVLRTPTVDNSLAVIDAARAALCAVTQAVFATPTAPSFVDPAGRRPGSLLHTILSPADSCFRGARGEAAGAAPPPAPPAPPADGYQGLGEAATAPAAACLTLSLGATEAVVRDAAATCLLHVGAAAGLTLTQVVWPHRAALRARLLGGAPLASRSRPRQIGTLHAAAFLIAKAPAVMAPAGELGALLQGALNVTAAAPRPAMGRGEEAITEASRAAMMAAASTPTGAAAGLSLFLTSAPAWVIPCFSTAATPSSAPAPEAPEPYEPDAFPMSYATLLEVASLNLAAAALGAYGKDLVQPAHEPVVHGFIKLSLASLTARPIMVVEAAHAALAQVIANKREREDVLPKELLQDGLRTVLLSLSEVSRFTTPRLRGLARLLTLLSSCFNSNLADKLLKDVGAWRNPDAVRAMGFVPKGEEPAVAAAVLNLFHRLPITAEAFLAPLVNEVCALEAVLHRYDAVGYVSSPFRKPLTRFCNRFPRESVAYFFDGARLAEAANGALFQCMLKDREAGALRRALCAPEGAAALLRLLAVDDGTPGAAAATAQELHYHAVRAVRTLCRFHPEWLAGNGEVAAALLRLWRQPARRQRLQSESPRAVRHCQQLKLLGKVLVHYCRTALLGGGGGAGAAGAAAPAAAPAPAEALFDLLAAFTLPGNPNPMAPSLVDFTFVEDFLRVEVPAAAPAGVKAAVLSHFLASYHLETTPQLANVLALRLLVIPVLAASFKAGQALVSRETATAMIAQLLGNDRPDATSEPLRIELLQLATLLITYMGTELVDHRKNLIKFAWYHLKSNDSVAKHWAYVNVCRFIQVYDTPSKIILQVFVALLRTFQQTSRTLVRTALDVLTRALPSRLDDADVIRAVKWTKKIVVEEGHSVPQLAHIWRMVVRHAALFRPYQSQFVPQMVNSLSRLGLPPTCPAENRELAVDLATLVAQWEAEALVKAAAGRPEASPPPPPGPRAPSPMVEMVANFVLREALMTADSKDTAHLSRRCVQLFGTILRVWPDFTPKFAYFLKLTFGPPARSAPDGGPKPAQTSYPEGVLATCLELLNLTLEARGAANTFVPSNGGNVMVLIIPCFYRCSPAMHHQFRRFFAALLHQFSMSDPPPGIRKFRLYPWLAACLSLRLSVAAGHDPQAAMANSRRVAETHKAKMLPTRRADGEEVESPAERAERQKAGEAWQSLQSLLLPSATPEANVVAVLRMLWAAAGVVGDYPDGFAKHLMDLLLKVVPDHLAGWKAPNLLKPAEGEAGAAAGGGDAPPAAGGGGAPPPGPRSAAAVPDGAKAARLDILLLLLKLVGSRVMLPAWQSFRTHFLSSVTTLLQQSSEPRVLWLCLRMVRRWAALPEPGAAVDVLAAPAVDAALTHREKLSLITAMQSLGVQSTASSGSSHGTPRAALGAAYLPLQSAYMKLVLQVYTGHGGQLWRKVSRSDGVPPPWLRHALRRTVVSGLLCGDAAIRRECFAVLGNELNAETPFGGKAERAAACTPMRALEAVLCHDWEPLASYLWLPVPVAMMLSALQADGPCVRAVLEDDLASAGSTSVAPAAANSGALLAALSDLAFCDLVVARDLWLTLFPSAWAALRAAQRAALTPYLAALLVRDHHQYQLLGSPWQAVASVTGNLAKDLPASAGFQDPASWGTNMVQYLAQAVSLARPLPAIRPEVLQYVGKAYGAWTVVIPLLEQQVVTLDDDLRHLRVEALSELYTALEDMDSVTGLRRRFTAVPETAAGLVLEAHGQYPAAQKAFLAAMGRGFDVPKADPADGGGGQGGEAAAAAAAGGGGAAASPTPLPPKKREGEGAGAGDAPDAKRRRGPAGFPGGVGADAGQPPPPEGAKAGDAAAVVAAAADVAGRQADASLPSKYEVGVWEERWTECCRQLVQWPVLREFAAKMRDPRLLAEACTKLGEWKTLHGLLRLPAVSVLAQRLATAKLFEVEVAINEKHTSRAANLCDQAAVLTLRHWCTLPTFPGSAAHESLLALTQRLVEAREALVVALALRQSAAQSPASPPDMRSVLAMWRERLPNRWDGMREWDSLLTWRHHVFTFVTDALQSFSVSDPQLLSQMHDAPWTVIRLARTARKLGLYEVCVTTLERLFRLTSMHVDDAFAKTREHILVCLDQESHWRGGLSLLNTTNVAPFTSQQRAELFRIKGTFLHRMGADHWQAAFAAFSQAQQLHPAHAKGWLSWAKYLHTVFAHVAEGGEPSPGARAAHDVIVAAGQAAPEPAIVKQSPQSPTVPPLAGTPAPSLYVASQAVACYLQAVNHRCKMPQLQLGNVMALLRFDDASALLSSTLTRHSDTMPVWVWVSWIPQLLQGLWRGEAACCRRLLYCMAKEYPQALYYTLRSFLLEARASPAPDAAGVVGAAEELLLYLRQNAPSVSTEIEAIVAEVIERFRPSAEEELMAAVNGLLTKCYSVPPEASLGAVPADLAAALTRSCEQFFGEAAAAAPARARFVASHRADFLAAFAAAGNADFPPSVEALIGRLSNWQRFLRSRVASVATSLRLQDASPFLVSFSSLQLEVPGQYAVDVHPLPTKHAKVQSFHPHIGIMHRQEFAQRQLTMMGDDGAPHKFLLQFDTPRGTRTDERMVQLGVFVNQLLASFVDTRKRRLQLDPAVVVPLTPHTRLFRDHSCYQDLDTMLRLEREARGMSVSGVMREFRATVRSPPATEASPHRAAYNSIRHNLVSDLILSQSVAATLPSPDALAVFRLRMTHQWALTSLLGYAFSVGAREPRNIMLSRSSGHVVHLRFRPGFTAAGALGAPEETVPFRLSPNVQSFFTQFGIDGPFSAGINSAARCVRANKDVLGHVVQVLLRDELVSWRMATAEPAATHAAVDVAQRGLVTANTNQVLGRVGALADLLPAEGEGAAAEAAAGVAAMVATLSPETVTTPATELPRALATPVCRLIALATADCNLSHMKPTWHPWF